jgi:hypothetical protein
LGLPTNALNKIFMNLYDKVDTSNYLFSIQKSLLQRAGVQRFPKNAEFIDALKVRDVYNIKSKNRTYLFERLENFENNERVMIDGNSSITVEHIFPQNPDPKWKTLLGSETYTFIRENYLNTVGNLTLSGNNGKLGNKPFIEKRDLPEGGYRDSRLWWNKYLATVEKWDEEEIDKRFAQIADRALRIWKFPNIAIDDDYDNGEVNIFEADDPKYRKLEYAVFFDQRLEINQVAKLYAEVFKQLFELQPEPFFTTDLGQKIGLTKYPEENGIRQPVALNDTYFIEANFDSVSKFERIKQALTIFDSEDELIIKYASNT